MTPDIIAVSNKHTHSLIFDCKGGINIDDDQIYRYKTLKKEDIINWIDIYTRDQLKLDVCIAGFENNHSKIVTQVDGFPVISFGDDKIIKDNFFKTDALNIAFRDPISLENMLPPMNYYPFSDTDDMCVIIPHLIRGLVSMATEKGRAGPEVLSQEILDVEEILQRIHKMWPSLSQEHKNSLRKKW